MRILIITNNVPYPPNSGLTLRVYNLLYRLAKKHEIWLATFTPEDQDPNGLAHLNSICKGVVTSVFQNSGAIDNPIEMLLYLIRGTPPNIRLYKSHDLIGKIIKLVTQIDFDIIQIEDSHMSAYFDILPKSVHQRTLLTFIDVNFHKFERLVELEPKRSRKVRVWLHSRMMRRWEPSYAEKFARCIAMSDSDQSILQEANPKLKIEVIPNGVDTKGYQPLARSENATAIIFVGNMAYRPNIDAVSYFCHTIYPRIKAEFPQAEFWIVGKDPAPEVEALGGNGVRVTGQVEDLLPYYRNSAVSVVPLRAGGGTRLKILESMALGRPVVATSIGCEGLNVIHGKHILIADDPEQFAEYTLQLLRNMSLWIKTVREARELVVNHYDWDVIAHNLEKLYEEVNHDSKEGQ